LLLFIAPKDDGYSVTVAKPTANSAQLPLPQAELAKAIDVLRKELLKVVSLQNGNGDYLFQADGASAADMVGSLSKALPIMANAGARLFQQLFYGARAGLDANAAGDFL
jgi:hypothetical protein